jgi:hypothetical protein
MPTETYIATPRHIKGQMKKMDLVATMRINQMKKIVAPAPPKVDGSSCGVVDVVELNAVFASPVMLVQTMGPTLHLQF